MCIVSFVPDGNERAHIHSYLQRPYPHRHMTISSIFGDEIVEHLGLYDIFQRHKSFRVVGAFPTRAPQET